MPLSVLGIGLGFIALSLYLLGLPPATQAILSFGRGIITINNDVSYSITTGPTRALTAEGQRYQLDPEHKIIQQFDKVGHLINQWGSEGSGEGQFLEPQLLGLDQQQQVYVYDKVNFLQKFDATGHLLNRWPAFASSGDGIDLAVSETGEVHLLVKIAGNYYLNKYSGKGEFISLEKLGWLSYSSYPVQMDSAGRFYTLRDTYNGPIHGLNYSVVDANGTFLYDYLFSSEARLSSRLWWGLSLLVVLFVMLIGLARLLEVVLKDLKIRPDVSYLPFKRLVDPDPNQRAFGAQELGLLADPVSFEPLLKALGDPSSMVRGSAAWALGRLGDRRAVEPLLQALPHETLEVQVNIIMALGELRDKRAFEPLLALLGSEHPDLRASSGEAFGKLGDLRAVAYLKEGLFNRGEYRFCQPLLGLGQPGLEVLLEALNREEVELRKRAVRVLSQLHDPQVIAALLKVVTGDENNAVRKEALSGLGNLGAVEALPVLTELAQTELGTTSWGDGLNSEVEQAISKLTRWKG
jgi:HEAT repeat protein